jgi:hypothetical protein
LRLRVERALLDEDLAKGRALVENPGMHRCYELVARDEVHLQCEDAE